jgi:ubiquinone/menaquinone biosynthesis C-methylase UbiE
MLAKGYVEPGILTNLPYEDNSFDLVFSSDVLEHIHPEEADIVISELIRVSRRHVFMSISLKARAPPALALGKPQPGHGTPNTAARWVLLSTSLAACAP